MNLEVECYPGYTSDERPVRFRLYGHDYFVEELLDRWYGPDDTFFKVRARKPIPPQTWETRDRRSL
jgi:hypothetical protein